MQTQPHSETTDRFFTRAEAADYVREKFGVPCAKTTLQKLVTVGGGPVYRVFGRNAVYRSDDLDAWVMGRMSAPRHSSSN